MRIKGQGDGVVIILPGHLHGAVRAVGDGARSCAGDHQDLKVAAPAKRLHP